MPPRPTHLPYSLVGLPPVRLQPPDDSLDHAPPVRCRRHPELASAKDGVEHLAVDVQLALAGRGVADPDRTRVLVAGQPAELVLVEPPLSAETVHDLEVFRIAGDRAQHPVAPADRLFHVAGRHQRVEREDGVPQPAVAVVPVPDPAQKLRQRGRRGGHDPARRRVRQRLEGDQRAPHLLGPAAPVGRAARPLPPPRLGLVRRGAGSMGAGGASHEGYAVSRKLTRCPGPTVNSAVCWKSWPWSGTSLRSSRASGPAPTRCASPPGSPRGGSVHSRSGA